MIRTMQEILIEADEKESVWELQMLWNEMAVNKYDYTLVHLWFAREHIDYLIFNVVSKIPVTVKAEL